MLQRALSNAYSWWLASHIRAKQTRWLDNNVQDVEKKVKYALKLIEEDGDSFAKMAEMYYRKRPELVKFIQELHNSHLALAERYERVSGELQKANSTIATIFPDQVHYESDDDDDDHCPQVNVVDFCSLKKTMRPPNQFIPSKKTNDISPPATWEKMPKPKRIDPLIRKDKEQEELHRLQTQTLVLRMEREIVKSSYMNGLARYLEIETILAEMEEEICDLGAEFGIDVVINEDEESQVVMAIVTLKLCKKMLVGLHERHREFSKEGKNESQRMKDVGKRLRALREERGWEFSIDDDDLVEEGYYNLEDERVALMSVCDKVGEDVKMGQDMNKLEVAKEIDELVAKVVVLETTASSLMALVHCLRLKMDELENNFQAIEAEKVALIDDSNELTDQMKHILVELSGIKGTDKCARIEGSKFQSQFIEACQVFNTLSERLQPPMSQHEVVVSEQPEESEASIDQNESDHEMKARRRWDSPSFDNGYEHAETEVCVLNTTTANEEEKVERKVCAPDATHPSTFEGEEAKRHGEESKTPGSSENNDLPQPNWEKMFRDGLDERQKVLLNEYTSILRNFKDMKRNVVEEEKKNKECLSKAMARIQELRNIIEMKDEQIRSFQQELKFLESSWKENTYALEANISDRLETSNINGDANEMRSSTFLDENVNDTPSLGTSKTEQSVEPSKEDEYSELQVKVVDGQPVEDGELQQVKEMRAWTPVEEKFRKDIDKLLEENLEFWLRFTTSFDQIQRYQSWIQDLQAEILELKNPQNVETSGDGRANNGEATSICERLKGLQVDMSAWIEQNALQREELQKRFLSLCNIEEEISKASKEPMEGGEQVQLSAYQAVKFQGEVLSMTNENNIVADELDLGLDHVKGLQEEVTKSLAMLEGEIDASGAKGGNQHNSKHNYKNKTQLKSFLFDTKPLMPLKFSCMKRLQKQYSEATVAP